MGPSDAILKLVLNVNRVAGSDFNVVILGETGSGKELVAKAIHQASCRAKGPFVPVDCGAIPETIFESELFGYEKGAFTGAEARRQGKYETAHEGTLFLDEISNMPLGSQAKLLRILQEKVIYRVGGNAPVKVNVRLLVASNQDLEHEVETGAFRQDLFFRLSEFTIRIPPLRERKEDIPYLAKRFLDITNVELNKDITGFSEEALETIFNYSWPGNVRQFQSTIRRGVLLADEVIGQKHLDIKRASIPGLAFTPKIQGLPWNDLSLKEIVRQSNIAVEKEVLLNVLKYTGGNKAKAARLLKIDYKTIHTKVKQFKIFAGGGKL
jgi:two-component system nitrogen regulation response regulator GlnG